MWIANTSDGRTHVESKQGDGLSSWRKLMLYCETNKVYLTNLRMTVDKQTVSCPPNAIGYWQSNAMPSVQGRATDEELHEWHGIGWVEQGVVNIIWGAMDPRTHKGIFWRDSRPSEGQGQIIWGPDIRQDIPQKVSVPTAGVQEFLKKIGT